MHLHLNSAWILAILVSAGQDARHTYHYYLPLQAYLNDMLATNDIVWHGYSRVNYSERYNGI